jgi:hypothetical protein
MTTDYTITVAKYAKNVIAVCCKPISDGWKSRAGQTAFGEQVRLVSFSKDDFSNIH